MSRILNSIALAAIVASVGAAGLAAPAVAKEAVPTRSVRTTALPGRMPQGSIDRMQQVEAMKQASLQSRRANLVPASDSVGDAGARQTFAVATGRYGR